MQYVSQLGTVTRGDDKDKSREGSTLKMKSLLGTRTITTSSSNKTTSSDELAPHSLQEEDEQLQRALAASLGSEWPASRRPAVTNESSHQHGNNDLGTPLLSVQHHPSPAQDASGYFC